MMQRPYRNVGFFFLLLFVLVIAGFTPRIPDSTFFGYFSHVARGGPVPLVIHLHAAAAVAWFTLLSVQPFLIRAKRFQLHRLLGKVSILVVVLFFITGVQVTKRAYLNGIEEVPRETVLALLSQPVMGLTLFGAFYVAALRNRRNLHRHVAFMVGASLATATPGLARLGLYVVGGMQGILLVIVFIYAALIGFLLHAKFRLHQPVLRSPYLLIIGVFLLAHAMDIVGSRTAAWLWVADKIVSVW